MKLSFFIVPSTISVRPYTGNSQKRENGKSTYRRKKS